tara:strand:+ start:192 stop:428 length:237 start_codon:yes stop_codon:yes gene_type:complete
MKQIAYIIAISIVLIAAPIVAFGLSAYTFFIATIAFIQGAHQGIMNNLHGENTKEIEEEPKDIWEKHIKKMADKAKLN